MFAFLPRSEKKELGFTDILLEHRRVTDCSLDNPRKCHKWFWFQSGSNVLLKLAYYVKIFFSTLIKEEKVWEI